MKECGSLSLDEPFAGLQTQGMICHETYRDQAGKWMFPTDVVHAEDGALMDANGNAVKRGRSEKMSKSKRNVVDPEEIIGNYGADTARLFMLSDSPPDRDLDWTDSGIDGAWRYVNRLWRLVDEPSLPLGAAGDPRPADIADAAANVERLVHKTIQAVSDDLERFHFNKAVARIRELSNALEGLDKNAPGASWVMRFGIETVSLLIGPMMPHLAEEMWRTLGYETLVAETAWPVADTSMLSDETVTIGVQINGKLRGTIDIAKDADQDAVKEAALTLDNVQSFIGDKEVRKVIVVPNRIVNVVI